MKQYPVNNATYDDTPEEDEIIPWTAEQAEAWRAANPSPSLWQMWKVQAYAGLAVVVASGLVQALAGWSSAVVLSAIYGVLAALLPSALAIAGMLRGRRRQEQAGLRLGAGFGFASVLAWEGVKVMLTIVLLALAPLLMGGHMNWLAMLAGFVVTLKAYWLAWMRTRSVAH